MINRTLIRANFPYGTLKTRFLIILKIKEVCSLDIFEFPMIQQIKNLKDNIKTTLVQTWMQYDLLFLNFLKSLTFGINLF